MAKKHKSSVAVAEVLGSVEADAAEQFEKTAMTSVPKWAFDLNRLPAAYREAVEQALAIRPVVAGLNGEASCACKLLDRVIRSIGAAGRHVGKAGALAKRTEDKAARAKTRAEKKAAEVAPRKEKLEAQLAKAQARLAGRGR